MWALVVNEMSQICSNMMGVTRSQVMMNIHEFPHNVARRPYKLVCCLLAWMGLGLIPPVVVQRHLAPMLTSKDALRPYWQGYRQVVSFGCACLFFWAKIGLGPIALLLAQHRRLAPIFIRDAKWHLLWFRSSACVSVHELRRVFWFTWFPTMFVEKIVS